MFIQKTSSYKKNTLSKNINTSRKPSNFKPRFTAKRSYNARPFNNKKPYLKKNYNFRAKIQAKIQRLFRKRKNIKSRSLFYLQRRARDKEIKLKRDLQTGLFGFFNRWKRARDYYKNRYVIRKFLFKSLGKYTTKTFYRNFDKVKRGSNNILQKWYLTIAGRLDVTLVKLKLVPTIPLAHYYIRTRRVYVNNQLVTYPQQVIEPGSFIMFNPNYYKDRTLMLRIYGLRRKKRTFTVDGFKRKKIVHRKKSISQFLLQNGFFNNKFYMSNIFWHKAYMLLKKGAFAKKRLVRNYSWRKDLSKSLYNRLYPSVFKRGLAKPSKLNLDNQISYNKANFLKYILDSNLENNLYKSKNKLKHLKAIKRKVGLFLFNRTKLALASKLVHSSAFYKIRRIKNRAFNRITYSRLKSLKKLRFWWHFKKWRKNRSYKNKFNKYKSNKKLYKRNFKKYNNKMHYARNNMEKSDNPKFKPQVNVTKNIHYNQKRYYHMPSKNVNTTQKVVQNKNNNVSKNKSKKLKSLSKTGLNRKIRSKKSVLSLMNRSSLILKNKLNFSINKYSLGYQRRNSLISKFNFYKRLSSSKSIKGKLKANRFGTKLLKRAKPTNIYMRLTSKNINISTPKTVKGFNDIIVPNISRGVLLNNKKRLSKNIKDVKLISNAKNKLSLMITRAKIRRRRNLNLQARNYFRVLFNAPLVDFGFGAKTIRKWSKLAKFAKFKRTLRTVRKDIRGRKALWIVRRHFAKRTKLQKQGSLNNLELKSSVALHQTNNKLILNQKYLDVLNKLRNIYTYKLNKTTKFYNRFRLKWTYARTRAEYFNLLEQGKSFVKKQSKFDLKRKRRQAIKAMFKGKRSNLNYGLWFSTLDFGTKHLGFYNDWTSIWRNEVSNSVLNKLKLFPGDNSFNLDFFVKRITNPEIKLKNKYDKKQQLKIRKKYNFKRENQKFKYKKIR